MKKFCGKLAELARAAGLSNIKLGEVAGVSGAAANAWLRGQSLPNIDKARLLADHFKVSLDYLIREEVDEPRPAREERPLREDEVAILAIYHSLNLNPEQAFCRLSTPLNSLARLDDGTKVEPEAGPDGEEGGEGGTKLGGGGVARVVAKRALGGQGPRAKGD